MVRFFSKNNAINFCFVIYSSPTTKWKENQKYISRLRNKIGVSMNQKLKVGKKAEVMEPLCSESERRQY